MLGQPGAVAYQIFDQKAKGLLNKRYYEFSHPIEADSIDELARKISIEPAVLTDTIHKFNNAVRKSTNGSQTFAARYAAFTSAMQDGYQIPDLILA